MTENMITVALIIGDPGHEGLQLDEVSLAAPARMIEGLGAATHGRGTRAGAALCGASTLTAPAPRISRRNCKPSGPGSLNPSSGGPSGQPRSSVSAEGSPTLPVPPGCPRASPGTRCGIHPVLRHLPFLPAQTGSSLPEAGDGRSPAGTGPRPLRPAPARSGLNLWRMSGSTLRQHPSPSPGRRQAQLRVPGSAATQPDERSWAERLALCGRSCGFSREGIDGA